MKKRTLFVAAMALLVSGTLQSATPEAAKSGSPSDNLPPNMTRLTTFGERASWSPDGSKIAFMAKSFGDAFEIDIKTKNIKLLTHYPNPGYLRVQYLPNGDYLLIGASKFEDIEKTRYADQTFSILKAGATGRPIPLNQEVSEGVAISRKTPKIAWAIDWRTSPTQYVQGESAIYTADIVYEGGQPRLVNKKEVVRAKLPECRLEAQDFRNDDSELIYVCYRETGPIRLADIYGVNLRNGKTITYRKLENEYNEAEGIFSDGRYILVESSRDQHTPHGSKFIDIWKLRLEPNSTDFTRVTRFTDFGGYKSSNPVVSPDGNSIAFQEGHPGDATGVGHGIFVLKLE